MQKSSSVFQFSIHAFIEGLMVAVTQKNHNPQDLKKSLRERIIWNFRFLQQDCWVLWWKLGETKKLMCSFCHRIVKVTEKKNIRCKKLCILKCFSSSVELSTANFWCQFVYRKNFYEKTFLKIPLSVARSLLQCDNC